MTNIEQSISYAYIARKPCGCLAMAIVDDPEHMPDNELELERQKCKLLCSLKS